jgi:hypothetical protein
MHSTPPQLQIDYYTKMHLCSKTARSMQIILKKSKNPGDLGQFHILPQGNTAAANSPLLNLACLATNSPENIRFSQKTALSKYYQRYKLPLRKLL